MSGTVVGTQDNCFFFDEQADDLHRASTFIFNVNVKQGASVVEESMVLAKLTVRDKMVQHVVVHHTKCLAALYKRANRAKHCDGYDESNKLLHGIALAEFLVFIEETSIECDVVPVFR